MKLRLNDKSIVKAALLAAAFCVQPTAACDTVICFTKHGDWDVTVTPRGAFASTPSTQGGRAIYACGASGAISCAWGIVMPGMDCEIDSEMVVAFRYGENSHLFPALCAPSGTTSGRTMYLTGESAPQTKIFFSNEVTATAYGSSGKSFTHTFSSNGASAAILFAHEEFALFKAQNAKP